VSFLSVKALGRSCTGHVSAGEHYLCSRNLGTGKHVQSKDNITNLWSLIFISILKDK